MKTNGKNVVYWYVNGNEKETLTEVALRERMKIDKPFPYQQLKIKNQPSLSDWEIIKGLLTVATPIELETDTNVSDTSLGVRLERFRYDYEKNEKGVLIPVKAPLGLHAVFALTLWPLQCRITKVQESFAFASTRTVNGNTLVELDAWLFWIQIFLEPFKIDERVPKSEVPPSYRDLERVHPGDVEYYRRQCTVITV